VSSISSDTVLDATMLANVPPEFIFPGRTGKWEYVVIGSSNAGLIGDGEGGPKQVVNDVEHRVYRRLRNSIAPWKLYRVDRFTDNPADAGASVW